MRTKRFQICMALLIAVVLFCGFAGSVLAGPPEVYSPWGTVMINGQPAPNGIQVTAWIDGVQKGSTTTINGYYDIAVSPGATGDTVVFKVSGYTAPQTGTWVLFDAPQINLTVTIPDTPTPTATFTPVTPTNTPTNTPTHTPTNTPTITPTPTNTYTPTPTLTPSITPTPTETPEQYWFNGYVYDDDTGEGIPGVTLKLYRWIATDWSEIKSTTTSGAGYFGLWAPARAGKYAVVEIDLEGYTSTRAWVQGGLNGEVVSPNRIEFDHPPYGLVGLSKFYDAQVPVATPTSTTVPPTETPTLPPTETPTLLPDETPTATPIPPTETPTLEPTPTTTSTTVTVEEGGTLTSPDGNVGVTAPPGAVSEETILTYTWKQAESGVGFCAGGYAFDLDAETLGGTPVITFTEPLTIVIEYDITDPWPDFDEENLKVYQWDDVAAKWVALPTVVDTEAKTLTAMTDVVGSFSAGWSCWFVDLPLVLK